MVRLNRSITDINILYIYVQETTQLSCFFYFCWRKNVVMRTLIIWFAILFANFFYGQKLKDTFIIERSSGKGLVDSLGQIILPPNYENVSISRNNKYVTLKNIDSKYGVLNEKLDTIIPFEYDYINNEYDLFVVSKNDTYGMLNSVGQIVLPLSYKRIYSSTTSFNGFSYEKIDGSFGYIDENGKKIFSNSPYWIEALSKKYFLAKIIDEQYIVNKKLKKVHLTPIQFTSNGSKKITKFYIKDNVGYSVGLFDLKKGKELIPPHYKSITLNDTNGLVIVENKNGYYLLNNKFQAISEAYEKMEFSRDESSLIKVFKNKKYGFLNLDGSIAIDFIFDEAESFSEGLTAVVKNGYWGFINTKGETVIDFTFVGKMESFINNKAKFYKGNITTSGLYTSFRASFIDKNGNYLIEPYYEELDYVSKSRAIGYKKGTRILIDLNTKKEIIELTKDDRIFQIER